MFFKDQRSDVFAHEVCDGSVGDKDVRCVIYLGACTQGKLDALHRKGLPSPIHTEVRVLFGFCLILVPLSFGRGARGEASPSPRGGWEGVT